MPSIPEKHKRKGPTKVKFAIITVSSSRYKAKEFGQTYKDVSGDLLVNLVRDSGNDVVFRKLIPDAENQIFNALSEAVSKGADAIVFSGGTGVSPHDVTIEAIEPQLTKKLPGFGELFRRISYEEIGSPVLLTRSSAGIRHGRIIFVLPGSPNAVKIAMKRLILPEVKHVLAHLRE